MAKVEMTDRAHIWTTLATEADHEAALANQASYTHRFARLYALACRREVIEAEMLAGDHERTTREVAW